MFSSSTHSLTHSFATQTRIKSYSVSALPAAKTDELSALMEFSSQKGRQTDRSLYPRCDGW